MKKGRTMPKAYLLVIAVAAACALPAYAKDLSALQTAVGISRQEMESAQVDYNASRQSLEASRKNLAQAQQQFADAQKKNALAQKKYQQAKARYDRSQSTLDNAWKQ